MTDSTAKISNTIIGLLEDRSGVSFAEVNRELDRSETVHRGDYAITTPTLDEKNIVMWAGVTNDYVDAFGALMSAGIVELRPTSWLTYHCDGVALTLPIATQLRRYKKLRWLPVALYKGPRWQDRGEEVETP